jgi:protein LSM14
MPGVTPAAPKGHQSAADQAAAAVAAAMAKLPGAPRAAQAPPTGQAPQATSRDQTDNLSQKFNQMRVDDQNRQNFRGAGRGRGRGRGGLHGGKSVAIPDSDFDFESSNAKFNKQDLAKGTVTSPDTLTHSLNGSAVDEPQPSPAADSTEDDVVIPQAPPAYDKKSSFFDNISSEMKDREDKRAFVGSEFRTEERKKNIETFGQGSVDGYRGGYRGRGRGGRGRGRGTGGGYRGRGGMRGARGGTATGIDS